MKKAHCFLFLGLGPRLPSYWAGSLTGLMKSIRLSIVWTSGVAKVKRIFNLVRVFGWCQPPTATHLLASATITQWNPCSQITHCEWKRLFTWSQTELRNLSSLLLLSMELHLCLHEWVSVLFDKYACLKKSQGERMSQMIHGGQQNSTVVSIQVHTGNQMKLGIYPVESSTR